ncbi:probable histone H2B 4 [Condylostylus longicornis]|uniref:probable histone H2B 4 n=1 Tax=Condylostylus longicornis TaxID=2530218 RepID=UPI00244E0F35|nr:probable histone H2B 4 [Condylostylus longicornis]
MVASQSSKKPSPSGEKKVKRDKLSSSKRGNAARPDEGIKGRQRKRDYHKYSTYILRIMRETRPELNVSLKAMKVFNSFVCDLLERLATEAGRLANFGNSNKQTMGAHEIRTAVKLILNGELQTNALNEGDRAVRKFIDEFVVQQPSQKTH